MIDNDGNIIVSRLSNELIKLDHNGNQDWSYAFQNQLTT